MQRMEIDAAPIWVVNGIRYQMVKIHEHGEYHDQPRLPPALLVEKDSNQPGNYQVKQNMNKRVRHAYLATGRDSESNMQS